MDDTQRLKNDFDNLKFEMKRSLVVWTAQFAQNPLSVAAQLLAFHAALKVWKGHAAFRDDPASASKCNAVLNDLLLISHDLERLHHVKLDGQDPQKTLSALKTATTNILDNMRILSVRVEKLEVRMCWTEQNDSVG
ncbi:hypothetical protein N7462_011102 [Penicillium macrosclerotiorum]|uniref:uncharacterized protein n=1 Tax=Penicillium macrosclerotiorum TaxID=303699 RepID=UPI002548668B|nr:uncharacterized protein N7462_011102 [Penicillium macrosclerotiorum]KAJ5666693.1 hypothetical protein N7462_011102 [Penicillium macrosclerotiorum]